MSLSWAFMSLSLDCLRRTVGPFQPDRGLGIARHAPVAARRQADRADLRSVGQAGAFELIGEETPDEHGQPLAQLRRCIRMVEARLLGQEQDLVGGRAVTKKLEQEEVVQLVRPY